MSGAVRHDPDLADALARQFVRRLVARMARMLDASPHVAFDLAAPRAEDADLLFELCFHAAAAFEDRSGYAEDGAIYLPQPVFVADPPETGDIVAGGSLRIHGLVEDAVVSEVLAGLRGAPPRR
ncbi:hypothetical protein [Roseivivax isoporae]|uniref:Uncharacterized protein n=1 Tax=Roseivivax isoporae LMG 25204 TaxID=1449351 RepID=X7F420_9RHOB|nr:hypothetical protein [Roseivivax isoporae]ETX27483.1 hypothetical protein RISW2_13730 [Roseivivax isoporae LMG 25204]